MTPVTVIVTVAGVGAPAVGDGVGERSVREVRRRGCRSMVPSATRSTVPLAAS